jgi:hypothetical protein
VTRQSINEYLKAIRGRYVKASKAEKGRILDEFTQVTGLHRKAALKLFGRVNKPTAQRKRGRQRL